MKKIPFPVRQFFRIEPEHIAAYRPRYQFNNRSPILENSSQLKDFLTLMIDECQNRITFKCGVGLYSEFNKTISDKMGKQLVASWGKIIAEEGRFVHITYSAVDSLIVLDAYRHPERSVILTGSDKLLYDIVDKILSTIIRPDMSDYEKVLAVHDYLVLTSAYTSDPDRFWKETPKHLVTWTALNRSHRSRSGVLLSDTLCDGYARAMFLLLRLSGVQCQYVIGRTRNMLGRMSPNLHAWNMVCIDGQWAHVDVTWDDPVPDTEGKLRHSYFCLSDSMIAKDHIWDRNDYPTCDDTTLFYYERMAQVYMTPDSFLAEAGHRASKGQNITVARVRDITRNALMNAIARYNSNSKNSFYVSLFCDPDYNDTCQVNMAPRRK